jgi:agmatine deiminase
MPNVAVIMSSFDDEVDNKAKGIMQALFPERTIIQIPSLTLFAGGGGIHCVTQQQLEGISLPPF